MEQLVAGNPVGYFTSVAGDLNSVTSSALTTRLRYVHVTYVTLRYVLNL